LNLWPFRQFRNGFFNACDKSGGRAAAGLRFVLYPKKAPQFVARKKH
jgi:hypothetical protein